MKRIHRYNLQPCRLYANRVPKSVRLLFSDGYSMTLAHLSPATREVVEGAMDSGATHISPPCVVLETRSDKQ